MSLEEAEVLAASEAWVYVPDDAREVRTDDFHLVAYPLTWADPTAARVRSSRPAEAVIDEVLATAAGLGRRVVDVWVTGATRPTDLAEHLLARGATRHEELSVLARDLVELPDLDVPAELEVREVDDLASKRDADRIGVQVFGGAPLDDEALAAALARATPEDGTSYVARRGGTTVAVAGLSLRDGVARLWGGATLPEARGAGAYRALLDHRLRVGAEHGARMALVKGRLDTSAPILRRAGFAAHGRETSYRLG